MNHNPKSERISILYAPSHYYLDGGHCGSELYWAYGIVRAAAEAGYSGDILTGYVVGDFDSRHFDVHELWHKKQFSPTTINAFRFLRRYTRTAKRLLSRRQYSIVHHILPFALNRTFSLLALFGRTKGRPYIIGPLQLPLSYISADETGVHARTFTKSTSSLLFWFSQLPLRAFSFVFSRLSRATLRTADALVVINEATRKEVLRIAPGARVDIIPPAVDVEQYTYTSLSDKHLTEFHLLSVGHLVKRKGVDIVLRSFAELYRQYPFLRLNIVGDGPERASLEEFVQNHGLEEVVTFHGFIPNSEIARFYSSAHLFVSMSHSESFGQMYLEAMASGVPVIASTTIGSSEIVQHEHTGILVPSFDSADFSAALLPFLSSWSQKNTEVLEQYARQSRHRVEAVYSWPVIWAQYDTLYKELIQLYGE